MIICKEKLKLGSHRKKTAGCIISPSACSHVVSKDLWCLKGTYCSLIVCLSSFKALNLKTGYQRNKIFDRKIKYKASDLLTVSQGWHFVRIEYRSIRNTSLAKPSHCIWDALYIIDVRWRYFHKLMHAS